MFWKAPIIFALPIEWNSIKITTFFRIQTAQKVFSRLLENVEAQKSRKWIMVFFGLWLIVVVEILNWLIHVKSYVIFGLALSQSVSFSKRIQYTENVIVFTTLKISTKTERQNYHRWNHKFTPESAYLFSHQTFKLWAKQCKTSWVIILITN